ncbi:MAG: ATP-binding protein [Actinomycetota bacterium]
MREIEATLPPAPTRARVEATSVLEALGTIGPNAFAVFRPVVVDGALVDAVIEWLNDDAKLLFPAVEIGQSVYEFYGRGAGDTVTMQVARLAYDHPGDPVESEQFTMMNAGVARHFRVIGQMRAGLLALKYNDVTAEVTSERAIADSEHNFRALLDGLDAGVVLLRPIGERDGTFDDAEIVWANNASRAMWVRQEGLAPGTRVAETYFDHREWLSAARQAWAGTPVTRLLLTDSSIAHWTSATEVLRRVGDNLVELTFDRTNDELLVAQLAELDRRFAAIVEDLPLTVLVGSIGSDELSFVSPNAEALIGLPLSQLRFLSAWDATIHPDDLAVRALLDQTLLESDYFVGRWRCLRSDMTMMLMSVRIALRPDPADPNRWIGFVADITEQDQMAQRVLSSERMETLGRTAGSIAHDFNNLLMIAAGNIDRAKAKSFVDTKALDMAAAATARASKLANSLLAFAKGRPGEPVSVNLATLIDAAKPVLRGTLPDGVTVRTLIADPEPVVTADPTHIEQVLLNLVVNARDAMSDTGTLTISVERRHGARCHLLDAPADCEYIALAVTDTGSGIEPSIIPHVWEPFFSSRSRTQEHGTGLGMATVHGIAHQYGGHAMLDSQRGIGTTVTVYFPTGSIN